MADPWKALKPFEAIRAMMQREGELTDEQKRNLSTAVPASLAQGPEILGELKKRYAHKVPWLEHIPTLGQLPIEETQGIGKMAGAMGGLGGQVIKKLPLLGDLMAIPEIRKAGQEAEQTGDVGKYTQKMIAELFPIPMRTTEEDPISQNPMFRRLGKQLANDPKSLIPSSALGALIGRR